MHNFTCSYHCPCGQNHQWKGTWELIGAGDEIEEIRITGRGKTFDAIIGSSRLTDYFCIPSVNIGIPVDDFADSSRIHTRLLDLMPREDAATIVSALKDYFS